MSGKILIVSVFFIIITGGCKKAAPVQYFSEPDSFDKVFQNFWIKMNTNYVYWDIDATNWNSVYTKYKPIFSKLDIQNSNDLRKSVSYFREMTGSLLDNHYYISFQNSYMADSSIYPAFARKSKMSSFHYPFSYFKTDTSYLDKKYILAFDNLNAVNGVPLTVLTGTIQQNILFFSFNHCSLFKSFNSANGNVKSALQFFFEQLSAQTVKGVIVDVRSNQGGDIADLNFLVGRFIDSQLHFGFTKSKSGTAQFQYTPWIKAFVSASEQGKKISVPIIVLTDNVTASTAEAITMALHCLPKTVTIGETTWGATGPVTSEELYNDGSFSIPGFLSVQTASCQFKYIDNKIYEETGFPPDIPIAFNYISLLNNKDVQLEKAISLLQY